MKKSFSTSILITVLLLLGSMGIVSGDYIGPDRTVMESRSVTIINERATNMWVCTVITDPPEFSAIGCSQSEFNYYRSHQVTYSFSDGEISRAVTYPPATISGSFVCSNLGENGWCKAGPGIDLSALEPVSGYVITSIEGTSGDLCSGLSCTWTPPEGEGSIIFWAHSSFGDTSEQSSASYKVDTAPPSVGGLPGSDGMNGWYVSPMSISSGASDATSGIASEWICLDGSCGSSITLTEGTHTVQMGATDNAGNSTASQQASVQVDLSGPTFDNFLSPDGSNGWFKTEVSLMAGAVDPISGVASESICLDGTCASSVTLAEGVHTITRSAIDNAGNPSTAEPLTLSCDLTPPKSTFTVPSEGSSIISPGTVTLSGMSTDALSGIALAQISIDGGSTWQELNLAGDSWNFVWNTSGLPDGTYPVYVRAGDLAGNLENTAQISVIVSNKPPQVSLQKWFLVGRPGALQVTPNPLVPLAFVRMEISGGNGHPDRVINLGTRNPNSVIWDGQWGDAADAYWGNYPVTVTACDIYGNCNSDSGTIFVPYILPPLPSPTPTPTPTPTLTPAPTQTALPVIPAVITSIPPTPTTLPAPTQITVAEIKESPQPIRIPWPFFAVSGLLTSFCMMIVLDPRPAALRSLGKQLDKIVSMKNDNFTSKEKQ